MSSEGVVIDVQNLSKRYEIYANPRDRLKQLIIPSLYRTVRRVLSPLGSPGSPVNDPRFFEEFWALRDVSFQIRSGETFGIIGRNGSGKSTLLQLIAGTLTPTSGQVDVRGRVAALLELGSGFNPEFSGRENVFLNGRILGLSHDEIADRLDDILAFADIGSFIDQPVKTYSSGMFVRLAFAVQAHIDAAIIIIDEALAVGDVFFRQKCYQRLERLRQAGAAILLVSHAMTEIEQFCERAILLDKGSVRFAGAASTATKHYYLINQTSVESPSEQISSPAGSARPVQHDLKSPSVASLDPTPIADLVVPERGAFVDVSGLDQVGAETARCVAVAVCDLEGAARSVFRQGEMAVIHYEFVVEEPIQAPVTGVVLTNDRGVIVHGKNSHQLATAVPLNLEPGTRLVCQQRIKLDLGLGEYAFEVGLASLSAADWQRRDRLSHEEFEASCRRLCHVPGAGRFAVGLALRQGVAILTHHGVADLAGDLRIARA